MTEQKNDAQRVEQVGVEAVAQRHSEAVMMDVDAKEWHARIDELLDAETTMITFRGAGTVNGIDPLAAEAGAELAASKLAELVESGAPVALIYDGDDDSRDKPDIGSVFGMVADIYKDAPNVIALTAQREDWYYPKQPNAKLESAEGTQYETYVFPNEMPGAHKELTQSEKIVNSRGYRQIIVGPAGPIADAQLTDVSEKAASRPSELGPVHVDVIETRNNPQLEAGLQEKLASEDPKVKASAEAQIAQREAYPRGALFTDEGEFKPTANTYPGLEFSVDSLAHLDSRTEDQRAKAAVSLGQSVTAAEHEA